MKSNEEGGKKGLVPKKIDNIEYNPKIKNPLYPK
jgi:hypothetical protein